MNSELQEDEKTYWCSCNRTFQFREVQEGKK